MLKTKNEALGKDLGAMLEIYASLGSRSDSEAQGILQHIRSKADLASVLNFIRDPEPPAQPSRLPDGSYHSDTLPPPIASTVDRVAVGDNAHPQPTPYPGEYSAEVSVRALSKTSSQSITHNSSKPTTIYELPSAILSQKAVNAFSSSSATLFYVFTHEQRVQVFNDVYQNGTGDTSKASMSELCAIAAVGCQYLHDDSLFELRQAFYDVAKSFLDDCIESNPLRAMKVCTLLAMYNIMGKSTVALTYISTSLLSPSLHSQGYGRCIWLPDDHVDI